MLTVTRAQMSTVIVFWEGLVSEGKYPGRTNVRTRTLTNRFAGVVFLRRGSLSTRLHDRMIGCPFKRRLSSITTLYVTAVPRRPRKLKQAAVRPNTEYCPWHFYLVFVVTLFVDHIFSSRGAVGFTKLHYRDCYKTLEAVTTFTNCHGRLSHLPPCESNMNIRF